MSDSQMEMDLPKPGEIVWEPAPCLCRACLDNLGDVRVDTGLCAECDITNCTIEHEQWCRDNNYALPYWIRNKQTGEML